MNLFKYNFLVFFQKIEAPKGISSIEAKSGKFELIYSRIDKQKNEVVLHFNIRPNKKRVVSMHMKFPLSSQPNSIMQKIKQNCKANGLDVSSVDFQKVLSQSSLLKIKKAAGLLAISTFNFKVLALQLMDKDKGFVRFLNKKLKDLISFLGKTKSPNQLGNNPAGQFSIAIISRVSLQFSNKDRLKWIKHPNQYMRMIGIAAVPELLTIKALENIKKNDPSKLVKKWADMMINARTK